MMKRFLIPMFTGIVLIACIPGNIKEKMNEQLVLAQEMFADQHFKHALAEIEMHKLRTGSYPVALSELQFLSQMDSSMLGFVEYIPLDSGYELNLREQHIPSFTGDKMKKVELKYPAEFWEGLGCLKSNLK